MKTTLFAFFVFLMLQIPSVKSQNIDLNNDSIFLKNRNVIKCEIVAITKEYYMYRINPDKHFYKLELIQVTSYINNPTPDFNPQQPGLVACFDIGGICGFVNLKGDVILPAVFENAENFSEGLANVRYGKFWGYIDINGYWIIQPKFERAEPFKNGYARVRYGNKWGFIDKNGNWIVEPQFFRLWDFMPSDN